MTSSKRANNKHPYNSICSKLTIDITIVIMLSQLKIYAVEQRILHYKIFVCLPGCHKITSTMHMGPGFSHNEGNCCLNMNLLYQRMFIFRAKAITHKLVWLKSALTFSAYIRCSYNTIIGLLNFSYNFATQYESC